MILPTIKKGILCLVLVAVNTVLVAGQEQQMTRQQFSRLSLPMRAAYFESTILAAANSEGVDPKILWTIAYNETRFRPWLTSNKGAQGLMQFIPGTAARFDLGNPYNPSDAIRAAARYVRYLSRTVGSRLDSVLAAYNAGEGTVLAYQQGKPLPIGAKIINTGRQRTLGGVPPYIETISYVGRGLKVFRWLESRGMFPNASQKANFPAEISSSIERVRLFDPELGAANAVKVQGSKKPLILRTSLTTQKFENNPREKREDPAPLNLEVYYDPRSGKRYLLNAERGRMEKLDEAGPVIITPNIRADVSSPARSTFVYIHSRN